VPSPRGPVSSGGIDLDLNQDLTEYRSCDERGESKWESDSHKNRLRNVFRRPREHATQQRCVSLGTRRSWRSMRPAHSRSPKVRAGCWPGDWFSNACMDALQIEVRFSRSRERDSKWLVQNPFLDQINRRPDFVLRYEACREKCILPPLSRAT
jgi:hypothetical protein